MDALSHRCEHKQNSYGRVSDIDELGKLSRLQRSDDPAARGDS